MTEELIKLYADRKASKGYAFSKDTVWQKEFEAYFSYQETDDQLTSIEEIKKDMESNLPMDRLKLQREQFLSVFPKVNRLLC